VAAKTPPEPLTRDRRRALTREALVEAAKYVFAEQGFAGASLEEIAERAGFTRGAIYKNFANKEDLFFAVFDRGIQQQLDAFGALSDDGIDGSVETLGKAAEMWRRVQAADDAWYAFSVEFRLYALRNEAVRDRYVAHERSTRKLIEKLIIDQSRAAGVKLKVPVDKFAAIMSITSIGFQDAGHLNPNDELLYETFLELIMPAIVEFSD
jgi:AcrR family transcriptional regulator